MIEKLIALISTITWDQIAIIFTGAPAVWLTQQKNEKLKRYACLFGMAGQPFWIYCSWQAGQFGAFIVTFMYTYSWLVGIRNHWFAWTPTWWRKSKLLGLFAANRTGQAFINRYSWKEDVVVEEEWTVEFGKRRSKRIRMRDFGWISEHEFGKYFAEVEI